MASLAFLLLAAPLSSMLSYWIPGGFWNVCRVNTGQYHLEMEIRSGNIIMPTESLFPVFAMAIPSM